VGRRLYRATEGPRHVGPKRRHAMVGLGLEFEPGARSGMTPSSGARSAVRERKGRREGRRVGPARLGKEERSRLGRMGCAGRKEKKEKAGWLDLAGRKGERRKRKR
jgi:hypothetical protein